MDPRLILGIIVTITTITGTVTMTLQPGDTLTGTQGGTPFAYQVAAPTDTPTATHTPTPQVFRASGRVTLADGSPLTGVMFNGWYATTGADGRWAFETDHGGSWTFVPQLAGYVFQPPVITVTLPATGIDFVAIPATTPTATHSPTPTRTSTPTTTPTPTPTTAPGTTVVPRDGFAGVVAFGSEPLDTFDARWQAVADGLWFATTITDCETAATDLGIALWASDGRGWPVTTDDVLTPGAVTVTVEVAGEGVAWTELVADGDVLLRVDGAGLLWSGVVSRTLYAEAVRGDGHRVRTAPMEVR